MPFRKVILSRAVLVLATASLALAQSNPVPLINNPLVPDAITPGGGTFTLTVNGTGFVSGSTVNWNGSALATTFVSESELTASVLAANIATANTASVTVVNPAPGGGSSNVDYFQVSAPTLSAYFSESTFAAGNVPYQVITADFNRDGKMDFAAVIPGNEAQQYYNTVAIYLGNGDGTFQSPITYSLGVSGESLAATAGDFNNDGILDLAIGSYPSNPGTISILLGNGDGTFQNSTTIDIPEYILGMTLGDFNRDGNLDIAIANGSGISVFLGEGNGTFEPAMTSDIGAAIGAATGDFNRDGKLDLVVGVSNEPAVEVLLGNGDGTFGAPTSFPIAANLQGIITADVNEDGLLDVITANAISGGGGSVSVLLGNGTGTFQPEIDYYGGDSPWGLGVGDFNADGKSDLAVADNDSYAFSILLGRANGTLGRQFTFGGIAFYPDLALGDFNGDGRLDIVSGAYYESSISIFLNTPIILTPPDFTFPTQLIGTSSQPETFILTNASTAPLSISTVTVTGTNSSEFLLSANHCRATLASGASCSMSIVFRPTIENTQLASLSITDNGLGSPHVAALTGIGTVVEFSPTALNFGSVPVGQSSARLITLTNTGSTTLSLEGIFISGTDYGDFSQKNTCGTALAPNAKCRIAVTFTPQAQGHRTAFVEVFDNGGGSYQTVNIMGNGT